MAQLDNTLFLEALKLYKKNDFNSCEKILATLVNKSPENIKYLSLLANLYINNNLINQALALHGRMLELDNKNSNLYFQKGNLVVLLSKYADAVLSFQKAINIEPNRSDYLCNFGYALIQLTSYEDASLILKKAENIDTNNYLIKHYLGLVYFNLKKYDIGLKYFNSSEFLSPNFIPSLIYKSKCLFHLGAYLEAIQVLEKTLENEINKKNFEILSLLGLFNIHLNSLENALKYFNLADNINPNSSENLSNISGVQIALNDLEGALKNALKALEIDSKNNSAINNLANIYLSLGEINLALEQYDKSIQINPHNFSIYSNKLFCESLSNDLSPDLKFNDHIKFGEVVLNYVKSNYSEIVLTNDLNPDRVINIGFVSGDLRDHPVINFMECIFKYLDKGKFRLFAFHNYPTEDSTSLRLKSDFFSWHEVFHLSDTALAKLIQHQNIDILFDLSGHTGNNRLPVFALKAAPIQISWIGYPLTTGLKTIDYTFLDGKAPSGVFDKGYVEKIVYLPFSHPFQPANPSPSINALPALSKGFITLGMLNNARKFSNESLENWSLVLKKIPNSILMIGGISQQLLQENLLKKLQGLGIPSHRIQFSPKLPLYDFLELHHQIDFCLDTYPYSGGSTSAHSLWMGVPVLTLKGNAPESLQTMGHLIAHNLQDWGAESINEYLEKAKYWSEHLQELAIIRSELRNRFASVDGSEWKTYTGGVALALSQIWRRHCQGLPPDSFRVNC